ncbi:MAG: hypothetical protein HY204_05615 [Nitrospirae bacterium]|nr:hypothetical protein [Nitrospirota bacterium]
MELYRRMSVLCLAAMLSGCGGGGDSTSDNGSAPVAATFGISGTLSSVNVSGKSRAGLFNTSAPVNQTVTHVMAVSPTSQNATRVLAPINSDGSFTLNVNPNRPYVLVFIDSTQTGAGMIVGAFESNTLDSLAPLTQGETDLGTVSIDGTTETATGSIAYDALLASLGLSSEVALALGAQDDLCLRYINPDLDGDGIIDIEQPDRNFMLDFHVRYNMETSPGVTAPIDSIIGQYLPDTIGISYTGTGIYAAIPTSFYSGSFDGASVTLGSDPLITTGITGPGFGNYRSLGPNWNPGTDIPQGAYVFSFGDKTLTFTNVATRTDAEFTAATGIIMPFIKFNQTDPACEISSGTCTLAGIDYKWMKRTDSGWVDATLEELNLFVSDGGGFISAHIYPLSSGMEIGIPFPMTSLSGTVAWTAENAHLPEGLTAEEMAALPSSQICSLGLSYDDKLGMRIFSGFSVAAACAGS